MNNSSNIPLRLLRHGVGLLPGRRPVKERAVEVIKELTEGFDTEDIIYFVRKGKNITWLFPQRFLGQALSYIAANVDVLALPPEELLGAAVEARPDCVSILETEQGQAWVRDIFTITL